MKILKLIVLSLSILLLSGCWNYRELEDLAIVSALAIDSNENGFDISIEVVNSKKVGSSGQNSGSSNEEAPIIIYNSKAKTIREALDKAILESPKKLYLGHMNLLVISEEVAKKGIKEFVDYFMRDIEVRKSFTTTVVKNNKASDALKILQPIESITGVKLQSSFDTAKKSYGEISNSTFEEVIMCLFTSGRSPTIAAIEIIGDVDKGAKDNNITTSDPKTIIKISGSALFKEDKLVGYLDEKEAVYYSIVRGRVQTTSLSFPCDDKDNYANIIIDGLESDVKVDGKKDKSKATIKITGKSAISEYNCKIDLKDADNIKKIEDMANKEMEKKMKNTIKKVQEYNSDVFGFGEQLYRNNYKYWDKVKNKWDKMFPEIEVKIKSDIKIERISSSVETAKSR
jgi:spore germination protein KC